ncbi:MAG: hypothetical protein FJZ01_26595, partial [Candidatus Sericytochromatia bacterium]|nr:hypothetical protein [Candidatus Tanganyikabacteria bacterium]
MLATLSAFSFGYAGWGPHTEKLIRTFDVVERARGFEPPLIVDTRIRRNVRAVGFRGTALADRLGDRHRWLRELGNRNVLTGEDGIAIDHPEAARTLLTWIREEAARYRRLIFFCSCGPVEGCHRQAIASLLLEEAKIQGLDLEI